MESSEVKRRQGKEGGMEKRVSAKWNLLLAPCVEQSALAVPVIW